jgi:hypothetical protein
VSPVTDGAKISRIWDASSARKVERVEWREDKGDLGWFIHRSGQGFNPDRCIHIGPGLSGCEAISKMLPVGNPDTGWKPMLH